MVDFKNDEQYSGEQVAAGMVSLRGVYPEVVSELVKQAQQFREVLKFSPKMYTSKTVKIGYQDSIVISLVITCKNGVIEGQYVDSSNNKVSLRVSEDGKGVLLVNYSGLQNEHQLAAIKSLEAQGKSLSNDDYKDIAKIYNHCQSDAIEAGKSLDSVLDMKCAGVMVDHSDF